MIVEDLVPRNVPIKSREVVSMAVDINNKSPAQAGEQVLQAVSEKNLDGGIVLLRVHGKLVGGGVGDVDFRSAVQRCYAKGAFFVMRNTAGVVSESADEAKEQVPAALIEERLIEEFSGKVASPFSDEQKVMKALLQALSQEKAEGETNGSYEERVVEAARKVLE